MDNTVDKYLRRVYAEEQDTDNDHHRASTSLGHDIAGPSPPHSNHLHQTQASHRLALSKEPFSSRSQCAKASVHKWSIKQETLHRTPAQHITLSAGVKQLFQEFATPQPAFGAADRPNATADADTQASEEIICSDEEGQAVHADSHRHPPVSFETPAGPRLPFAEPADAAAEVKDRGCSYTTASRDSQGLKAQRHFISSAFSHASSATGSHLAQDSCALTGTTLGAQLQKCLSEDKISFASSPMSPARRKSLYNLICTARKTDGHLLLCSCSTTDNDGQQVIVVFRAMSGDDIAVNSKFSIYRPCHKLEVNGMTVILLPCINMVYLL